MRFVMALAGLLLLAGCASPTTPDSPGSTSTPTSKPTPTTTVRPTTSTPTPTPTPTSTPANDPAADEQLLSSLLPRTTPACPKGTPDTDATCGKLLDSSAELVDLVGAALKDEPKTANYNAVRTAVSQFQRTYRLIKKLGCYAGQPIQTNGEELCETFGNVLALDYLNLQSMIDALDPVS